MAPTFKIAVQLRPAVRNQISGLLEFYEMQWESQERRGVLSFSCTIIHNICFCVRPEEIQARGDSGEPFTLLAKFLP